MIQLFLIALPIGLLVDLLWIGVVANRFYRSELGELFAPQVNWTAALIFYVVYIAGLVFFVLSPAIAKQSLLYAVLAGAFFGLIAYATYDLTNLATVRNWPLLMSGTTYLIATTFFGR